MDIDTVVIGAGQAGLAVSQCLQAAGVDHLVLERGRVGETWRAQRWASFHVNTPNAVNGLPGMPYDGDDPDGFFHRDELVDWFERYVGRFTLPVLTGVDVKRVAVEDGRFVVRSLAGDLWRCRNVVVASGNQNVPKIPAIGAALPADLVQLDARSYRRPDQVGEGGALIIGSGQTGVQIAEDLADVGRRTWLSTSRVGRVVRRYRGRDIVDWFDRMGLLRHRPVDLPDPEQLLWRQPHISGADGGHTLSLQSLARKGVTLLGRMVDILGTTVVIGDDLAENAAWADAFSRRFLAGVDQYIAAAGIDAPPAEPDPAEAPFEGLAAMCAIRSLDVREAGISTVIWATGFTGDFRYLDESWLDDQGEPVHTDGVGAVPGLFYLGFPWLRTRASGLVAGVSDDANAVCERIVARQADAGG